MVFGFWIILRNVFPTPRLVKNSLLLISCTLVALFFIFKSSIELEFICYEVWGRESTLIFPTYLKTFCGIIKLKWLPELTETNLSLIAWGKWGSQRESDSPKVLDPAIWHPSPELFLSRLAAPLGVVVPSDTTHLSRACGCQEASSTSVQPTCLWAQRPWTTASISQDPSYLLSHTGITVTPSV